MDLLQQYLSAWQVNPSFAIPAVAGFLTSSVVMLIVKQMWWAWFAGVLFGFVIPYPFLALLTSLGMGLMREIEMTAAEALQGILMLPALLLAPSIISSAIGAWLARAILLFR